MPKLTDREIIALVDQELNSAMGAPDGEISEQRAEAYKYYNSEPLGNEVDGKSTFVTSDVSEVVDGIMPSLMRMFAEKDNLVSFVPVGPEDEQLAKQETDYISYSFFKKNEDWFMTLYSWFWDALVQKNGIVKAWWDDSEVVTEESYSGLTEAEVFSLLEDDELDPIERDEKVDETVIDGQIVTTTLHDIKFKRTTKRNCVRVEPVPPEEYRISSDGTAVNPSSARMVGHERLIKRSDLLEMGFDADIVADLPAENRKWDSEEKIARNGLDEDRSGRPDKSQEEVLVGEVYIKLDMEGDGRSELRQIFFSNGQLLQNEPCDRQPFHVICSKPLPHKHFGSCPAEAVMDIQRITTTLTRQMLDNLYQTNNPGHAINEFSIGENTMDDLLTTEIGGVKRFAGNPAESWAPITVPFTAGATFPMLEHWDKTKRDRTGVSSDSQGLAPDQLKHIQSSVLGAAMDLARGKIELIARIFAETGIKSLFLHIHEMTRKHQKKAETFALRGQWIEVDPSSWRHRYNVTSNIGLGIGSRESNLIHLSAVKDLQMQMVDKGGLGLTVMPQNLYRTALAIAENANLPAPESYFTDPGDKEAPPPNQEQIQLQQQQQAMVQRQQELDGQKQQLDQMKAEYQHMREMMKIEMERNKNEGDLMVKMEKLINDLTELEVTSGKNVPGAKV